MSASVFRIAAIELFERDVTLRLPFKFGVVTLTHAPQAFVRARIVLADGREGWGASAEMLAPKWFDKNLALTNDDNFDQLRAALAMARDLYLADGAVRTAYGHFEANYKAQIAECGKRELNPLVACFGPALIDRAILDALCRLSGVSFDQALRVNLPGIAPAKSRAGIGGLRHGRFSRRAPEADKNCRAPHGRHGRSDCRRGSGTRCARQRWAAGDTRRSRQHLRPHLVQAESRRQCRGGYRSIVGDRVGAGPLVGALSLVAGRQRTI